MFPQIEALRSRRPPNITFQQVEMLIVHGIRGASRFYCRLVSKAFSYFMPERGD